MTNDKDREKVEKGAVKEMLESLYVSDMKMHPDEEPAYWVEVSKIEAAIDALKPIAECQDPVSRDHVWWAYRNYFGVQYPSDDGFCEVIKNLSSVLPAPARSEEEIIRKIKTFLSYPWAGDRFRNEVSKLFSACSERSESAPDPADKEGGTDEK